MRATAGSYGTGRDGREPNGDIPRSTARQYRRVCAQKSAFVSRQPKRRGACRCYRVDRRAVGDRDRLRWPARPAAGRGSQRAIRAQRRAHNGRAGRDEARRARSEPPTCRDRCAARGNRGSRRAVGDRDRHRSGEVHGGRPRKPARLHPARDATCEREPPTFVRAPAGTSSGRRFFYVPKPGGCGTVTVQWPRIGVPK